MLVHVRTNGIYTYYVTHVRDTHAMLDEERQCATVDITQESHETRSASAGQHGIEQPLHHTRVDTADLCRR